MPPADRKNGTSLDAMRLLLTEAGAFVKTSAESLESRPAETYLPNLLATVQRIRSTFPRRPPYDSRHPAQWSQFLSGQRNHLDRGSTRYLCWEPEIATDERFLAYVLDSGLELTERPLAGLVRSCHHARGLLQSGHDD